MRFPNAYKGVSRIYLAEILSLVAAILGIVSAIVVLAGAGAAAAGSGGTGAGLAIGGSFFLAVTTVLILAGFIINIIGVSNASHDEPAFKTALLFIVLGILCSIVGSIFAGNPVIYSIALIVSRISEILVFWFCINGISNLAVALKNNEIYERADSLAKLILGVYIVVIVLTIVNAFVVLPIFINGIISIVTSVCMIVAYFMYLSLLGGAKRMLSVSSEN